MRRAKFTTLGILVLAVVLGVATVAVAAPGDGSARLRAAVGPEGILRHELAFQEIADQNDGTRASGTPGYAGSRAYVAEKLRAAGYNVNVQKFEYEQFEEGEPAELERTQPTPRTYENGAEFNIMEYSGSGDVTASIEPVDVVIPPGATPGSTSGCEASDFDGFTAGNVALIQRGTCTFGQKAQNAQDAGASAVLIFNEGQPGRTETLSGTLGGAGFDIPVLGTSFAVGEELYELDQAGDAVVRVVSNGSVRTTTTSNVIAGTPGGDRQRTVVVGAHLDSVPEGAGINDNGSGTATILEIALQMARLDVEPNNKVRFAFWGAEESGLLGSEYYVNTLPEERLNGTMVNLNFDMVGSPNFVRFVYDGDGSDTDPAGPDGSGQVERVFTDYFASQNLETDPTEFSGRSDYGPFIAAGIPAGGLFSGAEGIKTAEQAATYGGTPGVAYDECYHSACDDIDNLSIRALNQFSDAAAHATFYYGQTRQPVSDGTVQPQRTVEDTALTFKGPHAQR